MQLLLDDPADNAYDWVSQYTAATKRTGSLNIWAEGGTASCKGVAGISDVFASGIWTVDILFEFAWRGVYIACMAGAPQAVCKNYHILITRCTIYFKRRCWS
jgi:hypothetical protein